MAADRSTRNTIAMTLAWWYVRRLIRKRGAAAVAGLVAGEGLSLSGRKPKRHVLRTLFLLGLVAGAGVFWWRRRGGGGGDDWGGWEPVAPEPPAPAQPAPAPEPLVPDPVAT
jgi:hypothetical protein